MRIYAVFFLTAVVIKFTCIILKDISYIYSDIKKIDLSDFEVEFDSHMFPNGFLINFSKNSIFFTFISVHSSDFFKIY